MDMNSLNFDIDTLRDSINIWKILSLWSKKIGNISIPPHFVNAKYNNQCYEELLVYLFANTITESKRIELNEGNCKIASELFSFNEEYYCSMLDFHLSDPYSDDCSKCDKDNADCYECKVFGEFIHSFDFYKLSFKSFLIENNENLNLELIENLGELYASYSEIEGLGYVGCKYNEKSKYIEILYYTFYDNRDEGILSNYSISELINFFQNSLVNL